MKKSEWFLVGAAAIFILTGIAFYPYMPERMASHWNAAGGANGSMPRVWGVFLLPLIFAVMLAILLAVPFIDPKRKNIERFRKYYDRFIWGVTVFFYYVYLLTLIWNAGYRFDFTTFLIPALAFLFYAIGMLLPRTELNFMIGIRTPWTIANEMVWKKTHKAGGVVFKICGVLCLLGTAFPRFALWFLLAPVLAATIGLVVYSYVLYRREEY